MINYFKNGIIDNKAELVIDISFLEFLIKNNPQVDLITNLRSLQYNSAEYQDAKTKIAYVTPHGTFTDVRNNENVKQLSNYLYFDIDQKDINCNPDEYKDEVLKHHADKICMMGKSVGGQGLFFYVHVKRNLSAETFDEVWDYFALNVFKGIKIDTKAKSICRPQFISYDRDLYVNHSVVVDIPVYLYSKIDTPVKTIKSKYKIDDKNKGASRYINTSMKKCYTSTCTLINYKDVCKDLQLETHIDFPNNEDVIIKEVDYVRVPIVKLIKSGSRHNMFKIMVNTLVYLNPFASLLQIQSYVSWWNRHMTDERLAVSDMMLTVEREFSRLKDGGQNISRIKKKVVHTNPKLKNRKEVANKTIGRVKINNSINKINAAIEHLIAIHQPVTQKAVAEITAGVLSLRTIKSHWTKSKVYSNPSTESLIHHIKTGIKGSISKENAPVPQNVSIMKDETKIISMFDEELTEAEVKEAAFKVFRAKNYSIIFPKTNLELRLEFEEEWVSEQKKLKML